MDFQLQFQAAVPPSLQGPALSPLSVPGPGSPQLLLPPHQPPGLPEQASRMAAQGTADWRKQSAAVTASTVPASVNPSSSEPAGLGRLRPAQPFIPQGASKIAPAGIPRGAAGTVPSPSYNNVRLEQPAASRVTKQDFSAPPGGNFPVANGYTKPGLPSQGDGKSSQRPFTESAAGSFAGTTPRSTAAAGSGPLLDETILQPWELPETATGADVASAAQKAWGSADDAAPARDGTAAPPWLLDASRSLSSSSAFGEWSPWGSAESGSGKPW
jgi:hypothetical protein